MFGIFGKKAKRKRKIKKLLNNDYMIIMDACSINADGLEKLLIYAKPLLQNSNKKILIPSVCAHQLNDSKNKKNEKIQKTLTLLKALQEEKLLEIKGSKNDSDQIHQTIFSVVSKHGLQKNICVITENLELSQKLYELKQQDIKEQKAIDVLYIDALGYLLEFVTQKASQKQKMKSKFKHPSSCEVIKDDTPKPIKYVSKSGEPVYTQEQKEIILGKKLGDGGEGAVYDIGDGLVAKIYSKDKLTENKFEKIKLIISKNMTYPGICFPKYMLRNKDNEFIGYAMQSAVGKNLQHIISSKNNLEKFFPNFTKKDLIRISINFLNKVIFLHERNILLGDINLNNIIIKDSNEIYFVDADSYQINEYPCPVGVLNFTAPEIHNRTKSEDRDFKNFLRSFENEYFTIAAMLFTIMLPGQNPYASIGEGSIIDKIKKMDFCYKLEKTSSHKTPKGHWRFIWSHLPIEIRKAFFYTFKKGERYSRPKDRLSPAQWLALFERYEKDLPKLAKGDKMSLKIFPTRFRKKVGHEYIICPQCGKEEMSTKHEMCYACDQKQEVFEMRNCIYCDRVFRITKKDYDLHMAQNIKLPTKCKECTEQDKQCGNMFQKCKKRLLMFWNKTYRRIKSVGLLELKELEQKLLDFISAFIVVGGFVIVAILIIAIIAFWASLAILICAALLLLVIVGVTLVILGHTPFLKRLPFLKMVPFFGNKIQWCINRLKDVKRWCEISLTKLQRESRRCLAMTKQYFRKNQVKC